MPLEAFFKTHFCWWINLIILSEHFHTSVCRSFIKRWGRGFYPPIWALSPCSFLKIYVGLIGKRYMMVPSKFGVVNV